MDIRGFLAEDTSKIAHALPNGHVAAVPGSLKQLRIDRIIDTKNSTKRERIKAMLVARPTALRGGALKLPGVCL